MLGFQIEVFCLIVQISGAHSLAYLCRFLKRKSNRNTYIWKLSSSLAHIKKRVASDIKESGINEKKKTEVRGRLVSHKKVQLCAINGQASVLEKWIFLSILALSRPPKAMKTTRESDEESSLLVVPYSLFLIMLPVWELSALCSMALDTINSIMPSSLFPVKEIIPVGDRISQWVKGTCLPTEIGNKWPSSCYTLN